MKSALEQSTKEKIKAIAKEKDAIFPELWRNLILERFLTRLAASSYKEKFILKGGALLARYIHLGRETQDLDFFIQKLSNTQQSLTAVLQEICGIDMNDGFSFEVAKIKILDHSQLAYTGAEVTLQALFGATKTVVRLDLGFGDRVEPIEYPINLMFTAKGPLFEKEISLYCYPKEFIFAEKLETVVFRGGSNTRMKDFHDLYSLICLDILDISLAKKAIALVFHHRKTLLSHLPTALEINGFAAMEKNWSSYRKKIQLKKSALKIPDSIQEIVSQISQWLEANGFF